MRKHQRTQLIVFITAIQRAVINIPRIVHFVCVLQVSVVVAQHIRDVPTRGPHPIVIAGRERRMIPKFKVEACVIDLSSIVSKFVGMDSD